MVPSSSSVVLVLDEAMITKKGPRTKDENEDEGEPNSGGRSSRDARRSRARGASDFRKPRIARMTRM
ncbi:MAG: hypothetical protein DMF06_01320 [Verrucomicrobia bacterium]|nr:MAG: hypothetical protein DMF06_01320 [Verrucomicrobiota bacterium]